jgi:hypothetical protein
LGSVDILDGQISAPDAAAAAFFGAGFFAAWYLILAPSAGRLFGGPFGLVDKVSMHSETEQALLLLRVD